jgi:hypothetical protein
MEQMLELMKSMQEEMRTHGAKMDDEIKFIQARTRAIQGHSRQVRCPSGKDRDRPETKGNRKQD